MTSNDGNVEEVLDKIRSLRATYTDRNDTANTAYYNEWADSYDKVG